MAYTTTSSVKRTTHSGVSRDSLQQLQQPIHTQQQPTHTQQQPIHTQQQPTHSQQQPSYSHAQQNHIYEEQPYYANEQSISGQNIGGDSRRTGGVIYDGDYNRSTNANGKISDGHSSHHHTAQAGGQEHFACSLCDRNLSGSRYILKDERPYCIKCYEDRFANSCEECKRKIGTDSKDLSYKDRHWHEKCFFCSMCKTPLVDKPFGCKNDQLFCGECYNQQFATRCDKCNQIFKPGTKKLEYRGQQFHEHCFTCFSCSQPIGTKSFIPKDQKSYCVPCYEQHFATKCTRCLKTISQGGVTYKNQPWHRECFTCTNCKNSLAGQRFTSRDEQPYCADCFARLFAKKCVSCTKPITGVGGTRYISFEDRHWHNECFVCQRCRSSLVGRGFLTEGPEIVCPDCGKREQYHDTEHSAHTKEHIGYAKEPGGYTKEPIGQTNGHRGVVSYHHRTNQ